MTPLLILTNNPSQCLQRLSFFLQLILFKPRLSTSALHCLFHSFLYYNYLYPAVFLSCSRYPEHLFTMMSLEPIPAEVTEGRLKAADVVHSVFASLFPSGRSQDGDAGNAVEVASQGLEASRWAPQKTTASSRGRGPADSPKTSSRGLTDSIWAPKKNNEPKVG